MNETVIQFEKFNQLQEDDCQQKIIDGFIDFRPYLGRCKFRDCQHDKEIGCALLQAVADKKVLQVRLMNYRQIMLSQQQR